MYGQVINKGKGLSPNWTATVCWFHQVLGILWVGRGCASQETGKAVLWCPESPGYFYGWVPELIAHFPTFLVSISLLLETHRKCEVEHGKGTWSYPAMPGFITFMAFHEKPIFSLVQLGKFQTQRSWHTFLPVMRSLAFSHLICEKQLWGQPLL